MKKRVTQKVTLFFIFIYLTGRMVVIAEACPPADTGSGRDPTETSGRRPRRKRWEGPE